MLIDTHCHLDAAEFSADRVSVIEKAFDTGVKAIVIPAVSSENWQAVKNLAAKYDQIYYALGIHPLYVLQSNLTDLSELEKFIADSINDPKLVAIGEIGLDFYVPEFKKPAVKELQEHYYSAQLKLAKKFDLPVLLHVRRSQDILLKYLRRHQTIGGITHAFNGSLQQAQQFLDMGFALGVGGAMTFARAKQIRRIITSLPLESFVLETDAPDMAPEWLLRDSKKARNQPAEVLQIANVFAELRAVDVNELINKCATNAKRVLPKLQLL